MKIHLVRTGGFTAIPLNMEIDSDQLSSTDAEDLQLLVENAHFFELPLTLTSGSGGADRFHYSLEIENKGQKRIIEIDESAFNEPIRNLIQKINLISRSKRG